MDKVGIVYDDIYLRHDTKFHPETSDRLSATLKKLNSLNIYGPDQENRYLSIQPRPANPSEISWLHHPKFIKDVEKTSKLAEKTEDTLYLDAIYSHYGETIASPGTYLASLNSVGGNFQGIDSIMQKTTTKNVVLCRPPGHHSNYLKARGFCVFNNVLFAAEYLFRQYGLKKVAIIDFDAHAGNGTEEMLDTQKLSGEVLFISIHQHPSTLYPGTCFADDIGIGSQQGKTMNITLLPYSGHLVIKRVFKNLIEPVVSQFKPEFILVSAGYDGHHVDPLTAMGYMDQTYTFMIKEICKYASTSANGRIQCTLEGGYNLDALGNSIANTIATLAGESAPFIEDHSIIDQSKQLEYVEESLITQLRENLNPYWKF